MCDVNAPSRTKSFPWLIITPGRTQVSKRQQRPEFPCRSLLISADLYEFEHVHSLIEVFTRPICLLLGISQSAGRLEKSFNRAGVRVVDCHFSLVRGLH